MIPTVEELQALAMSWDFWAKVGTYAWIIYRELSYMSWRKKNGVKETNIAEIKEQLDDEKAGRIQLENLVKSVAESSISMSNMIHTAFANSKLPMEVKNQIEKDWGDFSGTITAGLMKYAENADDKISEGLRSILPETDSPILNEMIDKTEDFVEDFVEDAIEKAPELIEKGIDTLDDILNKEQR